ncbi:hypothetical protein ElyMa_003876200 [Elysia marginata]|uniref:Uncharacterized protein n=1 Tax=Elysia marginata TaxID=1093978 RepID=A0AAV4FK62_9GAST|nr:hypothetical protein ElyMa_003876200 [Elysia marginata]
MEGTKQWLACDVWLDLELADDAMTTGQDKKFPPAQVYLRCRGLMGRDVFPFLVHEVPAAGNGLDTGSSRRIFIAGFCLTAAGRGFFSTRTLAGAPAQYGNCASRKQCKLLDCILAKKIMDSQENLKSVNSVKEVPSSKAGHISHGRDCHVRQVTPDRHLATVRNKIKIGRLSGTLGHFTEKENLTTSSQK